MILTKYLVNRMLRNQLIILIIFLLVFFSQKFIRVLSLVVNENIPKCLIILFFWLGIPEVMKLILPISLFIAILATLSYLRINNEMIAIYSSGVGSYFIMRSVLFVSSITIFFSLVNVFFYLHFVCVVRIN